MPTLNGLELFNKMRERDKSVKGMLLNASYEQLYLVYFQKLKELDMKIVKKPVTMTNFLIEINSLPGTNEESPYMIIRQPEVHN